MYKFIDPTNRSQPIRIYPTTVRASECIYMTSEWVYMTCECVYTSIWHVCVCAWLRQGVSGGLGSFAKETYNLIFYAAYRVVYRGGGWGEQYGVIMIHSQVGWNKLKKIVLKIGVMHLIARLTLLFVRRASSFTSWRVCCVGAGANSMVSLWFIHKLVLKMGVMHLIAPLLCFSYDVLLPSQVDVCVFLLYKQITTKICIETWLIAHLTGPFVRVWRGGGLGSRPKKMYGERLGDGVEYHLMSPTPRR